MSVIMANPLLSSPEILPHVGERIRIGRGNAFFDARLIGCIKGVSLLSTVPFKDGLRIDFLEGEAVEVRLFTGTEICSFGTRILHVCVVPVHYLHLGYPEEVHRQPLRHAPWVRVKLPSTVHSGGTARPVLMENLSEEGAKFDSQDPVGEAGELIRIAMQIEIDDMKRELALEARIEHVGGMRSEMREYGVSFPGLSMEDRLWLKCLVYRRIADGYRI